MRNFKPSVTLALNARATALKKQGVDVINLTVGELDFPTPKFICDAAYKGMLEGHTKYTPVDGTLELKTAIKNKFLKENNLSFETNEITVGNGGKQVIFNAFFATIEAGDEVLIPTPYWVSYPDMVEFCFGSPVFLTPNSSFKITPEILKNSITEKTKWFVLNSPSNPTGCIYSKEELKELANVLIDHPNILILSDDIYEHLIFEHEKFFNILMVEPRLKDRVFIANGVSKSHAMTGWRLGYGAGPKELISNISNIQSHTTSNPSSISQIAALAGLNGSLEFLEPIKAELKRRRDFLVKELSTIKGLSCICPKGAFYIYVKIESQDEKEFCESLLEKANVAVVPGAAFGLSPYFRISYAVSMESLEKAIDRIKNLVGLKN